MEFFVPHDVFQRILNFKDPRYEFVRAGNKTPSAQCMPFDPFINDEDLRVPWNGNTLMIWNRSAIVHHGIGQSPFDPSHISGGDRRQIEICSQNRTIEIVFYTGQHLDEIREGRRRGEIRRFWENHHVRLGTTVGQQYL